MIHKKIFKKGKLYVSLDGYTTVECTKNGGEHTFSGKVISKKNDSFISIGPTSNSWSCNYFNEVQPPKNSEMFPIF